MFTITDKKIKKKRTIRIVLHCIIYGFALFGLASISTYLLVKYNLTNETGIVDQNSRIYQQNVPFHVDENEKNVMTLTSINNQLEQLTKIRSHMIEEYCRVKVVNAFAGSNAQAMIDEYMVHRSGTVLDNMLLAVDLRLGKNQEYIRQKKSCVQTNEMIRTDIASYVGLSNNSNNVFPWGNDEIWETLKKAIMKDENVILQAAQQVDIDPRMLLAVMFVEQNRVYRTEREFVKSVLLPFSLLSTGSNASLGTMNIKPQTAQEIEKNLTDPTSQYYPGDAYTHLLDFSTDNPDRERIKRLTDYKNRYYSYLYGALYIKEYEQQWKRAGMPITGRPEIIGTLFNIGFKHSLPNASPKVGGSKIDIKGVHYTFGSLAYEFYYSGILAQEFPMLPYNDKK